MAGRATRHAGTRLPPEEWFPAGVRGISARRLELPGGLGVRVLEAGPGSGPAVVLLHGWAVSSYLWRHNILALAEAGHRVVAIDLPGHGLSDSPQAPGGYAIGRFTRAVLDVMDALGISRAGIAAQSMGGKVAAQVALEAPGRVSQLLLFGPVGFGLLPPWKVLSPIAPQLPGELPSLLITRRMVAFFQRRVQGKIGFFSERDVDEYWAPTQSSDLVRAQVRMLKEFDWAPWTPGELRQLALPVLVVFGTRDRTVRPVHAEGLVAELPQGRLEWIADGGHVVMEEAPDRINAMMLAALGSQR
jgi:pimeloyl-ACP methyl ester carboxylesterase